MQTQDETCLSYVAFFVGDADVTRTREEKAEGWRETYCKGDQSLGWLEVDQVEVEGTLHTRLRAGASIEEGTPLEPKGLERVRQALSDRWSRLSDDETRVLRVALHGLDKDLDLASVVAAGKRRRWTEGSRVLTMGDPGQHVFVVLGGTALARVVGRKTAVIGEGDVFGEMAVLAADGLRRTTVEAAGSFVAFEIPRETLTPRALERLWVLSAQRAFDGWIAAAPAFEYLDARARRLWLARSKTAVLDNLQEVDVPGHFFFLYDGRVQMNGLLFEGPLLLPGGRVLARDPARVTLLPAIPESTFT